VRQTYFVPVRESQAGTLALRTGRLPSGERVGLAFTSEASRQLTMGPLQHWARLAAEPIRDMLAPLGIRSIRIDPRPASELGSAGLPQPQPQLELELELRPEPQPGPQPGPQPRATGAAGSRAAKARCVHRARRQVRLHGCHAARQSLPHAVTGPSARQSLPHAATSPSAA
jgi:hypothetical protein